MDKIKRTKELLIAIDEIEDNIENRNFTLKALEDLKLLLKDYYCLLHRGGMNNA